MDLASYAGTRVWVSTAKAAYFFFLPKGTTNRIPGVINAYSASVI